MYTVILNLVVVATVAMVLPVTATGKGLAEEEGYWKHYNN
jgi:hypothetical protein